MSRSRKRTPIHGNGGGSEKEDKRQWHSRMRARVREAIAREDEVMPDVKEVSNPYDMAKDGKFYDNKDHWYHEKYPWRRRMK